MSRKHTFSPVSAVLLLALFATACMDTMGPSSGSDPILPGTWVPDGTSRGGQANGISTSPGPRTDGISTSPGPRANGISTSPGPHH